MAKTKLRTRKSNLKVLTAIGESQAKSLDSWTSPYDSKSNVKWSKTTPWKVTTEGERGFVILRYVRFADKTTVKERLDRAIYEHLKSDRHKCEEICRLLNHRTESKIKAKEAWLVRSSFVKVQGSELSQKFEAYMVARSSNPEHARKCRRMVEMHFLNYFYYEREPAIYDYLEWASIKIQAEYIEYLLTKKIQSSRMGKKKALLATKTIKAIIQYVNHFFRFIHIESDGNIPLLKLTFPSITKARLVDHTAKRKKTLPDQVPASQQYIDEATYKNIITAAPDSIKSAIWLAYHFGLRRSEVLGLELENIKKSHLKVEFQLLGLDIERGNDKKRVAVIAKRKGPLKNRDEEGRKVPFWYSTPAETYEHIKNLKTMHPSILSKEWGLLMDKLKLNFTFHNLRNAFCSNALRDTQKLGISPTDIQLALGHSDLRTTMIYLRDYRELNDDEVWTPEAG